MGAALRVGLSPHYQSPKMRTYPLIGGLQVQAPPTANDTLAAPVEELVPFT